MEISYNPVNGGNDRYQTIVCRTAVTDELSGEYVLPDYIGDVKRILHTFVRPRYSECTAESDGIRIRGESVFSVLMLTEEGKVASNVFSLEYTHLCECAAADGDISAMCYPVCENATARLLSPRKIALKARMRTAVSAVGTSPCAPEYSGTHTAADEAELECRTDTVDTLCLCRAQKSDLHFSEDMVLDGAESVIGEILYIGAEVSLPECRTAGGNLSVSGEMTVFALCTDPAGKLYCTQRRFPISATQKCDWKDGMNLWAWGTADGVKASVVPNSYGENKVIELDVTWSYCAEGECNLPMQIARDAYSTRYVCENTYAPLNLYAGRKCERAHITVNESRPRGEVGGESAEKVLFTSVRIQPAAIVTDENGCMLCTANAEVAMLVTDGEESPSVLRFTVPVKYEGDALPQGSVCDVRMEAEGVRGRLDSGAVYCDFEAVLCITSIEKLSQTALREVRFDRDNPLPPDNRPPITLYYPQEGESVWDIARRYHTTQDSILHANRLTSDCIHTEKVLMIPSQNKNGVYSGVI